MGTSGSSATQVEVGTSATQVEAGTSAPQFEVGTSAPQFEVGTSAPQFEVGTSAPQFEVQFQDKVKGKQVTWRFPPNCNSGEENHSNTFQDINGENLICVSVGMYQFQKVKEVTSCAEQVAVDVHHMSESDECKEMTEEEQKWLKQAIVIVKMDRVKQFDDESLNQVMREMAEINQSSDSEALKWSRKVQAIMQEFKKKIKVHDETATRLALHRVAEVGGAAGWPKEIVDQDVLKCIKNFKRAPRDMPKWMKQVEEAAQLSIEPSPRSRAVYSALPDIIPLCGAGRRRLLSKSENQNSSQSKIKPYKAIASILFIVSLM